MSTPSSLNTLSNRPVKWKTIVAYGVGDLYGGGSFVLVSLLFVFFLTDVIGLSPVWAGLVVMLGKGWDALSDPLMGYLSDQTRTRFGRRRVFFLAGVIPVGVTFSLLWFPLSWSSQVWTLLYFTLAYVAFSTVFTMVMVPYAALNAEITRDYRMRTCLSGARMICSGLGSLLVSTLPQYIIGSFDDLRQGYWVMGMVFGLIFALPWLVVFWGTWEVTELQESKRSSLWGFFRDMKSIFRNGSFRIHLGMYVCAYSALDVVMATALYVMTYYFQRQELFPICVGAMLLTQLLSLLFYVFVANRYGKGMAYMIGLSIWALAMLVGLNVDAEARDAVVVALFVLTGLGMSAGMMVPWAVLPSVTDVDELITGQQRAGVYAGSMTFLRKMIQALVLLGVGFTLDSVGYVANQVQSPETLQSLKLFFYVAPLSFVVVGLLVATRFRITPKTHRILTLEIERLRAGGDMAKVDGPTRRVCETLTGLPYDRLYGAR
jgi:oligogalacturonide transporter